MSETLSQLESFERKLRAHLKTTGELQQKSSSHSEKASQLEVELQSKQARIEALEEELKVARTASSIQGNGTDTAEAKGRINEMVREIDKCIALLNN